MQRSSEACPDRHHALAVTRRLRSRLCLGLASRAGINMALAVVDIRRRRARLDLHRSDSGGRAHVYFLLR